MKTLLRNVCESDEAFLFELYASTREMEMAQVPWTEDQKRAFLEMQFAAQKRSYAAMYPDAVHQIIVHDQQPVGRLYLARQAGSYHILDITIAADWRGSGIGSAVLKEILDEADGVGKPTNIYIENFNPSLRLFERLGFGTKSVDGYLILLERPPAISGELTRIAPSGTD
jgi:RimJ/RimL family protein N-acetyltransferase